MEQQRFTFRKNERLCSRTTIQELFTKGQSFVKYPFRVSYIPIESGDDVPIQLLISVSKKRFKRANKRNRVKRLVREAYRLNKLDAYSQLKDVNVHLAVAFVYLPSELLDFASVQKGVKKALKKLTDEVRKNEEKE